MVPSVPSKLGRPPRRFVVRYNQVRSHGTISSVTLAVMLVGREQIIWVIRIESWKRCQNNGACIAKISVSPHLFFLQTVDLAPAQASPH